MDGSFVGFAKRNAWMVPKESLINPKTTVAVPFPEAVHIVSWTLGDLKFQGNKPFHILFCVSR